MRARILKYLGNHALAALALVCSLLALAGSSYAALTISGSQIRNHSINPIKLNPRFISGNVRAWAVVTPVGRLIAGGGRPRVVPGSAGAYVVRWGVLVARRCATLATIDPASSPPTEALSGPISGRFTAGFAVASSNHAHASQTVVQTYNQAGYPTALGFDVIVVC